MYYSALTVFGLGITIIDFIGFLGHGENSSSGDSHHPTPDDAPGDSGSGKIEGHHGSYIDADKIGLRLITRIVGLLRIGVYFALGAGPTGFFALLTKHTEQESFLWSLIGGAGIAVLAQLLRRLLRRNLDSSIKPDEFIMEKGVIITPIFPGAMGKALVRRFGKETDLYVRCRDEKLAFTKGSEVRIIDYDEQVYWVEPV